MEDLDAEDDGYSDDDLDALPINAFHELQDNAVRSTQHALPRAQLPTLANSVRPGHNGVAGGFNQFPTSADVNTPSAHRGPTQPSSDYGEFDDDMLDGEIFNAAEQPALAAKYEQKLAGGDAGESTQREKWRQQRYGKSLPTVSDQGQQVGKKMMDAPPKNAFASKNELHNPSVSRPGRSTLPDHRDRSYIAQPSPGGPVNVEDLQVQIGQLLHEREILQRSIQGANDIANAKAGEIAIVRANASKVEREYENRANSLQKQHADEAARQKIEVDKARAELQKLATERDFLENDLAEGTKQIRNLQKAIKKGGEKATGKENVQATPKKNRSFQLRDGFEDDEVQPLSPSKLALRSKAVTPKGGAKRKRKGVEDSPVKPLELAQPKEAESLELTDKTRHKAPPPASTQSFGQSDERFQLIQKLFNRRFTPDEARTFERLANFAYPSQPKRPLSTILLDETSGLTYKSQEESLPSALGLIVVAMWSQCMDEQYHLPVHLLVDYVKYILELNAIKIAPDLTNDLMGLVQSTADIILVPRCQKKPPRTDRANIDSNHCLQIMQLMAFDCQCDDEEIVRFWRTMRFDFIMMLLNFVNPLPEIHLMLSLLHTSILEQSFAMIVPPNNGQQDASENHIIDNLSHLLINTPRPPPGEESPDAVAICSLRLEVLNLIEAMCRTDYSAESLAKHRLAIGCLVRVMNDELDRVYDHKYGHELRVELVNQSTRLLYHLTTRFPNLINMQTKLSVVPGGEKKFLIALTRLAFSEGGFYEQDIEDDVVDCAHQMLEARVSPEEAEGLLEAFSSAPISRK